MVWDIVKGVESLGRGCPFYKHSKCEEVPWPRVNTNIKCTGSEESWKQILGEKKYKEEIERLNRMIIPDTEDVISHHISIPSRVTYSTRLPYFKLVEQSPHIYSIVDSNTWTGEGNLVPGSCLVSGLKILAPIDWTFEGVSLSISGRVVQEITMNLITFMQKYLGMKLIERNDRDVIYNIPFFFSRDITYSVPLFVVGDMQFKISGSSRHRFNVFCDLTLLHTREEINQIKINHILRSDHLIEKKTDSSKWLYIHSYMRDVGEFSQICTINYDGSKDEEIKGLFWEFAEGEDVSGVNVNIYYTFSEGSLNFIDDLPQDLVSRMEFERLLSSMVCGSRGGDHGGRCGCYMFSTYFDDGDCSPGVTPRNGNLFIEFSKPIRFRLYVHSSRDWVMYR